MNAWSVWIYYINVCCNNIFIQVKSGVEITDQNLFSIKIFTLLSTRIVKFEKFYSTR